MRQCNTCGEIKDIETGFYVHGPGMTYRMRDCRTCHNKKRGSSRNTRRLVGWTKAKVDALRDKQQGACAICKKTDAILALDHDHLTMQVRGLLCVQCNLAIGALGDSVAGVERALEYLRSQPIPQ